MTQQPIIQTVQQNTSIAIQAKLDLLTQSYQPMIDNFYKAQSDKDWERFRLSLYIINPAKLTYKTLTKSKRIKFVHGFVIILMIFLFGTTVDKFSNYLLTLDLFKNDLLKSIITNNGSDKLEDVIKKFVPAILISLPFYILVYILLHWFHISTARKHMKDWTNKMFNLGLYKHVNPKEYLQIEPFVRDYFQLKQFEQYVQSFAKSSEVLEHAYLEISQLRRVYNDNNERLLIFNEEKQKLNEMLDVFQRNFFRTAQCFVSKDFSNFELDLGIISSKYSIYEIVQGDSVAKRIEPNTIPGADKLLQINNKSEEPIIRCYLGPHNFVSYKKSSCVCYKVSVTQNIQWIIKYKLTTDEVSRMKFLSSDDKIDNEDAIASKNIYDIVKLHLSLQHKYSEMKSETTQGGVR